MRGTPMADEAEELAARVSALLTNPEPGEGTLGDLARRLEVANEGIAALRTIADELQDDLAARMDQDLIWTGEGWLSRTPEKRSHWRDNDSSGRFRDDIASTVVRAVAVD